MKPRAVLYCEDFHTAGLAAQCCGSCHDDVEMGYDMIELEPPPNKRDRSYVIASVCCAVARDVETRFDRDSSLSFVSKSDVPPAERRKNWAQLIKRKRKRAA